MEFDSHIYVLIHPRIDYFFAHSFTNIYTHYVPSTVLSAYQYDKDLTIW